MKRTYIKPTIIRHELARPTILAGSTPGLTDENSDTNKKTLSKKIWIDESDDSEW